MIGLCPHVPQNCDRTWYSHTMEMTQRGQLSDEDVATIGEWMDKAAQCMGTLDTYRFVMVGMVGRSSYREVARLTGISTTTLQRWNREAGD